MQDSVITFALHAPSDVDVERSTSISERYGIRQAIVIRLPDGPEEFRRRQLGQAGAAILGDIVEDGDVLGVSWGRTMHTLVHGLARLAPSTIVQIVGNKPTSDLAINSLDLLRTLAGRSGGDLYALQVPMVLDGRRPPGGSAGTRTWRERSTCTELPGASTVHV
ncbi:DNA-binding transcriptional regulator LsrR (DeoR family) [Nakamurella sp. UYEF19]|uniref:sugar-binding domain-containing protein n=1 Tax=Nakamurella sp. UYEF19 TaxID=1756392 RepID=UPI00339165FC